MFVEEKNAVWYNPNTPRVQGIVTEFNYYVMKFASSVGKYVPVAVLTHRMNEAAESEYIYTMLWDNIEKYYMSEDEYEIYDANTDMHPDELIYNRIPPTVAKRIPCRETALLVFGFTTEYPLEYLDPFGGNSVDRILYLRAGEPREVKVSGWTKVDLSDFNYESILKTREELTNAKTKHLPHIR